jgi:hypothetical protein
MPGAVYVIQDTLSGNMYQADNLTRQLPSPTGFDKVHIAKTPSILGLFLLHNISVDESIQYEGSTD